MTSDKRCRDCKRFRELFGGPTGGGIPCKHDADKRKRIYALDYVCENLEEVERCPLSPSGIAWSSKDSG